MEVEEAEAVEGDGEVSGDGEGDAAEEEELEEWVAEVGEVAGEEEAERPLLCMEAALRRRRWRSVLERSRASAPRLASSAFVWLEAEPSEVEEEENALVPMPPRPPAPLPMPLLLLLSWGYFRNPGGNGHVIEPPEEGRRPEKLAARVPVRSGSERMLEPLPL